MESNKPKESYKPTQSKRFFPGRVSTERAKQLDNFEIDIDDMTIDDVVYCIHRTEIRTLYFLLDIIRRKWGEKAAQEAGEEFGYMEGSYNYSKFLRRYKRTYGDPEVMARYQDIIHVYYGPTAPHCLCSYGDDCVRVVRTECHLHTGRPEGMESMCKYIGEGFMKGYTEIDPAFVRTEKVLCLSRGDDCCDRIWYYKKMVK